MFSLENFYYILYANLLKPANFVALHFYPFGTTEQFNLRVNFQDGLIIDRRNNNVSFFYDQEPLFEDRFNKLYPHIFQTRKAMRLLANSEHSPTKRKICKEEQCLDWYYFYHGFAALDWYRDYQYFSLVEHKFTKVFISLNRLVTKDRSYRLLLVSKMIEKDLLKHGHVSLSLNDHGLGNWRDEIASTTTKLPAHTIPMIEKYIGNLEKSLVVDREDPQGNLSAESGPESLKLSQSALWHLVSETVFYYDKKHLTEKIFKPIVARRPFILVGAVGNLAYLKSYGFKTFDRWIDESYDLEPDHDKRLDMIIEQVNKLCSLSMEELRIMHQEMKEILDYNFNHLYGEFKNIIVDELVDNFCDAVHQWNHARITDNTVDLSQIDLDKVRQLLKK